MATTVLPLHDNQAAYVSEFFARRDELPGWNALRYAAIERFAALGFPTTKNEDWKYTNLAPFLKKPYAPAAAVRAAEVQERLASSPFADLDYPRVAFVNGRYAPELSRPIEGLRVRNLAAATGAEVGFFEKSAMASLNTALFEDGVFLEIAPGAALAQPVHILHVSTGGATYPRNLIVAGRESQAVIVESYLSLDGEPAFTNALTELAAGDSAVVEHVKLQAESRNALHFGLLRARLGASVNFTSYNIAWGAALARNEIAAELGGEGAECALNGLYVAGGEQHIDNYTTLEHVKPHTTSHEIYKGVLDGKAHGVFHGRIIVAPEAQKTDAIQRNKNLLLSRDAMIDTKPQLEIYADDVKCTHGATVGQVDAEAVFYLRSRGVGLQEARSLLTYAFASDAIEGMRAENVRRRLETALFAALSGGTQ